MVPVMYGDLVPIVTGLGGGIAGGLIGTWGAKRIADRAVKREEKEEEMRRIRDRLGAYTSLWRFLRDANNKTANHPGFSKICTHVLNSPTDYEWLRSHFVATRHLLSDKTYTLYLDSLKKDRIGLAAMYSPPSSPKPIPANYMALQEEAGQMCQMLKERLGRQDECG